jgi:hypothetical protein
VLNRASLEIDANRVAGSQNQAATTVATSTTVETGSNRIARRA